MNSQFLPPGLATKGKWFYRYLTTTEAAVTVPTAVRDAADLAAAEACKDLGVDPVTVVWFKQVPDSEPYDFLGPDDAAIGAMVSARFKPDVVYLNVTMDSPNRAAVSVVHEVRHMWQQKQGWEPSIHRQRCEVDAGRYENAYAEKRFGISGHSEAAACARDLSALQSELQSFLTKCA